MDNYPDGLTASDWRHIEGAADCEEQGHKYDRAGYCRECGEDRSDDDTVMMERVEGLYEE